jgi:hypothetical protein
MPPARLKPIYSDNALDSAQGCSWLGTQRWVYE